MNRKIVLVCVTLLLLSVIGTASAKTLYVDNCGCADFTKIQDAVNAANDGDIIIVRNGVYFENIKINKSLIIKSENGYEKAVIKSKGSKFNITANDVEIAGFTIIGDNLFDDIGIKLKDASGCIIKNNTITNNYIGVMLWSSSHNSIIDNKINDNIYGLDFYRSNHNIIFLNDINNQVDDIGNIKESQTSSDEYWFSPYKLKYTYKNKEFLGFVGNYWVYYVDFIDDKDKDGICDSAIGSDQYPLKEPRCYYNLQEDLYHISASQKITLFYDENNIKLTKPLFLILSLVMLFGALCPFIWIIPPFISGEETFKENLKRRFLDVIGLGICLFVGIYSITLYQQLNPTYSEAGGIYGEWVNMPLKILILYFFGLFIAFCQNVVNIFYKPKPQEGIPVKDLSSRGATRLEELPKVEKKEGYISRETISMEGTLPQIPNYQVIKRIGFGAFADVYQAKTSNNELVALKIPKIKQFETITSNAFLKEVRIWKNLNHPNIVKLYDYNEKPIPWLSMEYMDGGSLREKLNSLSINKSIDIIIKIAKAVEYAHNKGIIHRDIKPENILFKGSEPKLSDWGLGKLKSSVSTMSMEFKGTLMYASPEQIDPSTYGRVDERADIYQLGTLFYEMLTKKFPFEASDILSIREKKISGEVVEPSKLNPDIPKRIDKIILKCLAKNKEERYQNLSDLIRELGG